MQTWTIYNENGKPVMASFTRWLDCIVILAKLHRLGMTATMKGKK